MGLLKTLDDENKLNAAMRKHLRDHAGLGDRSDVKLIVKPLEQQQTFDSMVGYCSKDEGRSHYRTERKNVARTEVNVALTEYRKHQRLVVKENRAELGKRNFWPILILLRFKQENVRALAVSPQLLVKWLINDGDYVPSFSWICPTNAAPMEAARSDPFWVALLTPSMFTRDHAHSLFFGGGQGDRVSTSFLLWDTMDREFEDLTVDEAKICSHRRLELQGALDLGREAIFASFENEPAGILRYPVNADSDADETGGSSSSPPRPGVNPRMHAFHTFEQSTSQTSILPDEMPVVVHPRYVERGCSKEGNLCMIECATCLGPLHRTCGTLLHPDDADCTQRRCASCAAAGKGKERART